jgi:hypothetical protein
MVLLSVDHCAYEGVIACVAAALTAWNSWQQNQIRKLSKDRPQPPASEGKVDLAGKSVFPRR